MTLNRCRRIVWGGLLACLMGALAPVGSAHALCVSQAVGNTTYHTCDGKFGMSQKTGGTTVHTFDGKLAISQTTGATTIHSIDGRIGMSHRTGSLTIHSGPLFESR